MEEVGTSGDGDEVDADARGDAALDNDNTTDRRDGCREVEAEASANDDGHERELVPSSEGATGGVIRSQREAQEGPALGDTVNAMASDADTSVGAACAGPGDPHRGRSTGTVTTRLPGAVVADPVAAGGAAATLQQDHHARLAAHASRGEAALGPPCGSAAPQDGTKGADDDATRCETGNFLQNRHRGKRGGGPPKRMTSTTPQDPRPRLGVGPSIAGRELSDDDGGRPTTKVCARRRDGSADPGACSSAARGRGGAAAAGLGKEPQRGSRHRTQGAREPECPSVTRSAGTLALPAQARQDRRDASCGRDLCAAEVAAKRLKASHDGDWPASDRAQGARRGTVSGRRIEEGEADEGNGGMAAFAGDALCRHMDVAAVSPVPGGHGSHHRDGGGAARGGEDAEASSHGDATASSQGATKEARGAAGSQARHRQRRGPSLPMGPSGGESRRFDSREDEGQLGASSMNTSPHSLSPPPRPTLDARQRLRSVPPLARRARPGAPGGPLAEARLITAIPGGSGGHCGAAVQRALDDSGTEAAGDVPSPTPANTLGQAIDSSGNVTVDTREPKRRRIRLRGKQPVGDQGEPSRVIAEGAADHKEDQWFDQPSEICRPLLSATEAGTASAEASDLAAKVDTVSAAGAHCVMPRRGKGATDFVSVACGNSSASSGPSRFTGGTPTWQSVSPSPNRDGPELHGRGAGGGTDGACWRRRPPDHRGGAA